MVPIADRLAPAAYELAGKLGEAGLRAQVDDSRETVPKKVRAAQLMRVNYTLVVGDREIEAGTVSVRDREGHEVRGVALDDFVTKAVAEASSKSLRSSAFEPSGQG